MALILIAGDDCDELRERLARACPEHGCTTGQEPPPALRIQRLRRWSPSWQSTPADAPLLLLSPRQPADPTAAFMAGIDAWLPDNCSDEDLAAQVRAMLPAGG